VGLPWQDGVPASAPQTTSVPLNEMKKQRERIVMPDLILHPCLFLSNNHGLRVKPAMTDV
jgi:hypothetical protein